MKIRHVPERPDEDAGSPEATTSIEANLAFFDDPVDEKADQIDGAIGSAPGSGGTVSATAVNDAAYADLDSIGAA